MDPNPNPSPHPPEVPAPPAEAGEESITQPAKLLRIASMVRELLEETRQASLDEPGRIRLRQIYERAIGEDTALLLRLHQSNF